MSRNETKVIFIPDNYHTGFNILGYEIKFRNLVEGCILSFIPIIIVFKFIKPLFHLSLYASMFTSIFLAGICGYLGWFGIGGDTLGDFIYDYYIFNKYKRKAYYNPRVKKELKPFFVKSVFQKEKELLPRDKIIALYNKYIETMNEKNRKDIERENDEINTMYFKDDLGIIEKPKEYMSNKEIKVLNKKKKKGDKH